MSEIKMTIMRDDLCDNPTYTGAYLCLPASNAEIQDALERARIDHEHPDFSIMDYECGQNFLNELLPKKASLYELDCLARRLSGMSDYEKVVFEGIVKMEKAPDLPKLINLTYNLEGCQVVFGVQNDEQLGKFYVDNGFISELEELPEIADQFIDYEKVGRTCREAEKGVFIKKGYVMRTDPETKMIYDGTNIPKLDEDTGYVFKLHLVKSCDEPENAESVWLKLPASEAEIAEALSELGAASFFDCVFTRCESRISCFNDVFSSNEDIDMLNILSNSVEKIMTHNMSSKYKAVLQYEFCTDLEFAVNIANNLDCYEFYPTLYSPDDYGRKALLAASKLQSDDIAFKLLDFRKYGEAKMKEDGVKATDYGLVSRNDKTFEFEFSRQSAVQQML